MFRVIVRVIFFGAVEQRVIFLGRDIKNIGFLCVNSGKNCRVLKHAEVNILHSCLGQKLTFALKLKFCYGAITVLPAILFCEQKR